MIKINDDGGDDQPPSGLSENVAVTCLRLMLMMSFIWSIVALCGRFAKLGLPYSSSKISHVVLEEETVEDFAVDFDMCQLKFRDYSILHTSPGQEPTV